MARLFTPLFIGFGLLASHPVLAEEQTATLAVRNMDCAECPFIVRKSLERVPGVARVMVSFEAKTAIVTYDDSKVGLHALTAATTNVGYPSAPKS
jgi:periplasmic mercuric ion binding protein